MASLGHSSLLALVGLAALLSSVVHPTQAQATSSNTIKDFTSDIIQDFATLASWGTLRRCAQGCVTLLPGSAFGYIGCNNLACLCGPSVLGNAVVNVRGCAQVECNSAVDKEAAGNYLIEYCASKGYTLMSTSTTMPAGKMTGAPSPTATATTAKSVRASPTTSTTARANAVAATSTHSVTKSAADGARRPSGFHLVSLLLLATLAVVGAANMGFSTAGFQ
ncbi:MAG: hypothetical protein M1826_007211 [Phylliscum demangeonii]|nr:MAG: hypothetical protein M1826_007211 [Phylliscum demangeonii]